jgi:phenylalanyl-tRNA synthetase beta chain
MKVSLNWIKEYLDFELPPVDELVERIGAQLGAVEEVENLNEKYRGIIVAKVVSCVDHPDSDHMHLCKIDDGGKMQDVERDENGHVQVVCGASNVREGMMVAWLPPGSTVPESFDKDPFVLGTRELRGVKSNGMLASPRELALGDSHEGILDLTDQIAPGDTPLEPGADFARVFGLDDYIIDIENKMFTHRPDCFGQLGVAREVAGILGHRFSSPERFRVLEEFASGNEIPEVVPRMMVIAMKGIVVAPSPLWLQVALIRVGAKPINNVVDVTNYMMLLSGQPLHAYDYDKVITGHLCARFAHSNEKLELLNGKTIELTQDDMVISDGSKPIGLAGVMGGSETEVSETTTNIILECATFDMYTIRRTSMRHGLFTDAVTRFNKGQSPLQNPYVLQLALGHMQTLTGAEAASDVQDNDHTEGRSTLFHPVPVSTEFINTRLGLDLDAATMQQLLENVEFQIDVAEDVLKVTAPYWRTDIETREDVVEEVGRLYGFDKLPLVLPDKSIRPSAKDPLLDLKSKVRDILAKAGANEVLTYSFVHGDLLQKSGQDPAQAFQVGNALSPDLQYYRLSLSPSLLDKVHPNIKAGYDRFAIFEIGKAHKLGQFDDDGLPVEFEMLDLVYTAADKVATPGAAFYEARAFLVHLAKEFGVELEFRAFESPEDYQVSKPYDHTRSAKVFVRGTEHALGMVGEYTAAVRRGLKLPKATAGFSIGLTQLQQASRPQYVEAYRPLPRFPKVSQDITLKLPSDVPYQKAYDAALEAVSAARPESAHSTFEPVDIYQKADDPAHRQLTFRLEIASYERTLTDKEVSNLLRAVAEALESLGAQRI